MGLYQIWVNAHSLKNPQALWIKGEPVSSEGTCVKMNGQDIYISILAT